MNIDNNENNSLLKGLAEMLNDNNSNFESCPDEETLAAYSDGVLPDSEIKIIEGHIANCKECSELLVALYEIQKPTPKSDMLFQKAATHLEQPTDRPSKDIICKVKALVPQQSSDIVEKITNWFSSIMPVPAYPIAAMAIILLMVGVVFINNKTTGPAYSPIEKFNIVSLEATDEIAKENQLDSFKGKKFENYFESLNKNERATQYASGNFSAKIKVNESAYIYLVMHHSDGNIEKIFPKDDSNHKAKKNVDYKLPLFLLRDKTETKQLYLVAAKKEISDFDSKLNDLEKDGIENITNIFPNASIKTLLLKQDQ